MSGHNEGAPTRGAPRPKRSSNDPKSSEVGEVSSQQWKRGTYGYLALNQLLASAAADRRLTGSQLRALAALARYAGPDGVCCVRLSLIAEVLGIRRQSVHRPLKAVEALGYFTSQERRRKNGLNGAKVYEFNLDLAGAVACPVRWPSQRQLLAADTRISSQRLTQRQPPKADDKKPVKKSNEETSSPRDGTTPGHYRSRSNPQNCLQDEPNSRQQPASLQTSKKSGLVHAGANLRQRVHNFNQQQTRVASGRLWTAWARIDPDFALYDSLGDCAEEVAARAQDIETKRPGYGVRYIAGAVAKASRDQLTEAEILVRHTSRKGSHDD